MLIEITPNKGTERKKDNNSVNSINIDVTKSNNNNNVDVDKHNDDDKTVQINRPTGSKIDKLMVINWCFRIM